jgi:uncharacterized small protein (DUF1192 family)
MATSELDLATYRDCLRIGRQELIARIQRLCDEVERLRAETPRTFGEAVDDDPKALVSVLR